MKTSQQIIKDNQNKEYFNKELITSLVESLIKENNLEDYVAEIDISRHDGKLGFYLPDEKKIMINPDLIYASNLWYMIDKEHKKDEANIFLLDTIYHEITHVIQTKESDSSSNDLIHKVIKEGIELGRKSPKNLTPYEKFLYDFHNRDILTERNALFMSCYLLLLENEEMNTFSEFQVNYLEKNLSKIAKYGYGKNKNPLKTYYKLRHKYNEYKDFDFSEDYDDILKLSWGLPLNNTYLQELGTSNRNIIQKKLVR